MTLVTFAFTGLVAACLLAAVLFGVAKGRVRKGVSTRKAIFAGAVAPFLGLFWIAAAFLIHVQISNKLAHQDCGLSGDSYVTLPNGYELGSHNTYDGYIKAPGYETGAPLTGPGVRPFNCSSSVLRPIFHRDPIRLQHLPESAVSCSIRERVSSARPSQTHRSLAHSTLPTKPRWTLGPMRIITPSGTLSRTGRFTGHIATSGRNTSSSP